ncbi:hypothetical protein [uncultured Parasutterella sp.]|nr:hypothetical protein [uncultured Parasutterella sp.]
MVNKNGRAEAQAYDDDLGRRILGPIEASPHLPVVRHLKLP